jgi:hypothetical protein
MEGLRKTSVKIDGLRAVIWIWDFQNMTQKLRRRKQQATEKFHEELHNFYISPDIIIIIINCNWVSTRWQCSVYKYKKTQTLDKKKKNKKKHKHTIQ